MHNTPAYIRRINQTFYFRYAFPKPVANRLRSKEFLRSLRTRDETIARQLASYIAHDFRICLTGAVYKMNNENLREFLKKRFEHLVNSYKLALLTYPGYNLNGLQAAYDAGYIEHNVSPGNDEQLLKEAEVNDLGVETDFDLAVLREQVANVAKQGILKAAEFSHAIETFQVDEAAEKQRILESGDYTKFPEQLLQYHLHCLMQYRNVERGQLRRSVAQKISRIMETAGLKDPHTEPNPLQTLDHQRQSELTNNDDKKPSSGPSLQQLIDDYFGTKGDRLTERSKKAYSGTFNRLTFFLGEEFDLTHFSHKIAREFEAFLAKAPPHLNKIAELKGLSRNQLLEALERNPGATQVSPTTLKNHITRVSSLFDSGKRRGFVTTNFFEGWAGDLSRNQRQAEPRKRYTDKEVIQLLPSGEEQDNFKSDFEKHLCHLGAYTGMRLEEICSLHVGNIEEESGILIFNLDKNYPRQNYKNKNAKRIIPIHTKLHESGFVDFWRSRSKRASKSTPLFSDLTYREQQFSRKASRWFNERYAGERGWKGFKGIKSNSEQRLNFHSFRHTFISKLLEQKDAAPLHVIQFIVGHGQDSVTTRIYGSDAKRDIEDLKKLIDRVFYN